MVNLRVGNGYDVHKLVSGRDLFLGCVKIPFEKGLLGHSDADVLCHAIADAVFGASGLGDIGVHFPDNDDRYEGVSGAYILSNTAQICRNNGFEIINVDSIVVCQLPKIFPYIEEMKSKIAESLGILKESVNIKGTTEEGLGFTGKGEGISSFATCLVEKIK